MLLLSDRVKETSSTTGTGTLSLGGAVTGFQTFVDGIGDGNTTYYVIDNGSEWEVGLGTVTDATPDTLSRDTILASSNFGSAVDLSAGTKSVFCSAPADYLGTLVTHTLGAGGANGFNLATGDDAAAMGIFAYNTRDMCIAETYNSLFTITSAWTEGAQVTRMYLGVETTDATQTTLYTPYTSPVYIDINAESTVSFEINVIGRQVGGASGTAGDSWVKKYSGAIKRDASNNTALVGSVTETSVAVDAAASAWACSVTANDTDERLDIKVTGEANKTIVWSAYVVLHEIDENLWALGLI